MKTFWNGEPCQARRVHVIVADAPEFSGYWARPLVGEERSAVEVVYGGQTFYLDNEADEASAESRVVTLPGGREVKIESVAGYDGWAWDKVTKGQGSPGLGHRTLTIERITEVCEFEVCQRVRITHDHDNFQGKTAKVLEIEDDWKFVYIVAVEGDYDGERFPLRKWASELEAL